MIIEKYDESLGVQNQNIVLLLDGIALVQQMGKPVSVKSCEHLVQHFMKKLDSKVENYDEIHFVFDCYDIKTSLKTKTCQ